MTDCIICISCSSNLSKSTFSIDVRFSGGIVLIEALNILERYNLSTETDINTAHLVVEAMRRAYRDRADFLGDPDFVDIPVETLLSKSYADNIASNISIMKASSSSELAPLESKIEVAILPIFQLLMPTETVSLLLRVLIHPLERR